ncbi:DUF1643 domain-containing protein [Marinibaculum pumilum]|uniref:DUF1643 domain-containing protein n=1 Tax=Marinibaculum pumilum TaxID=1766165 RepID=A0ABV7KYA9_9PROT
MRDVPGDLVDGGENAPSHDAGGKACWPLLPGYRGAATFAGPGDCYRLRLIRDRETAPYAPYALWVGMNPSTAEAEVDDPTIRRELAFTEQWPVGAYWKINVGDYRATDPRALRSAPVPLVAPGSLRRKVNTARVAKLVVMAFGRLPPVLLPHGRNLVEAFAEAGIDMLCLGVTADGSPKHTLARGRHRIPNDAPLQPWDPTPWLNRAAEGGAS